MRTVSESGQDIFKRLTRRCFMPVTLSETIESSKSLDDVIPILTNILKLNDCKILSRTGDTVVIRCGSVIFTRLLGVVLISNYFNHKLPFKLMISIVALDRHNNIHLQFVDNGGHFVIRDSWSKDIYQQQFNSLLGKIKEKLCG